MRIASHQITQKSTLVMLFPILVGCKFEQGSCYSPSKARCQPNLLLLPACHVAISEACAHSDHQQASHVEGHPDWAPYVALQSQPALCHSAVPVSTARVLSVSMHKLPVRHTKKFNEELYRVGALSDHSKWNSDGANSHIPITLMERPQVILPPPKLPISHRGRHVLEEKYLKQKLLLAPLHLQIPIFIT
jgi:hypothetical protein